MGIKPIIMVTGSNGQLGKELRQLSSSFSQFEFVFLSREELPLHDFELIRSSFKKYHPDYCINCAAYTAVDKAEEEKELAFLINGEAVGVLAATCKENNCRFVHISTDYVFDGASVVPYKEDEPVNPQGVYGASKLEGEKQALEQDPSAMIIRTSWVYSEFGKNFVKTMLRLMNEKESISVVTDQIGSPTYAADLAGAIFQIIESLRIHDSRFTIHGGIYHFSNQGIISWYEFALAIKEITRSNCKINPIPTSQYPTPAKRPMYSALDNTKISKTFSIPLKPWKNSLVICLQRLDAIR